jgi:hypothetical protein
MSDPPLPDGHAPDSLTRWMMAGGGDFKSDSKAAGTSAAGLEIPRSTYIVGGLKGTLP